jgi:large conductance mechanosensitive channel
MKKVSLKQSLAEFRQFAFKGNMIDLAIAVVIGAAFKTVIDAVVADIIMPIISYIPGLKGGYQEWHLGHFTVGHLLATLINFVLVAFAVFLVIVKLLGSVMKAVNKPPEPGEPTTKECPKCLSVIPIKATKCAHCTSDLV